MRLRPTGNSGLLVTSLAAFGDYQRRDAWTWEHQALVRARVVAGHERLAEAFDTVRAEILGREREREALREEVVKMRHKMRDHLGGKSGEGEFRSEERRVGKAGGNEAGLDGEDQNVIQ